MRECIYGEVVVETHDCCGIMIETVKMGDRREEIVRCRDCVHFDSGSPIPICDLLEFGAPDQEERGFCAWGELDTGRLR